MFMARPLKIPTSLKTRKKMNVLRTGWVVVGLVMMTTTTMAQEDGGKRTPEERAQFRTERMAKELSLTDAQKEKLQAINLEAVKKHEEIRNDAKLTPEQKREAMKASHASEKAQLDALLTAEQKQSLETKMAERKTKRQEFKSEHADRWKDATPEQRAAWKTDRMAEAITLTDEQKTKITDLNLRMAKKNEAVRNDEKLTPEQKKAAMQENRQSMKAELGQILTAEQLQQLKEKKQHGHHGKGDGTGKPEEKGGK